MPADLKEPLLSKASEPYSVSISPPLKVLLNPVAWILWILDIFIWILTIVGPIKWLKGCCKSPPSGVQVGDGIWRHSFAKDQLETTPDPQCRTVHDIMQKAFKEHAKLQACGTRKYIGTHKPEWSKFPLAKFAETEWITYEQFGEQVRAFGAGLLQLGVRPATNVDLERANTPHAILLFEDTSVHWMTACMGSFSQSIVVATAYSTLGIAAVAESIKEVQAKVIVCNIKDVEKVAGLAGTCPTLDTIIYTTNYSTETKPKGDFTSHKVLSMAEVIELGRARPSDFSPPKPDTLAVIMYTSGSTGKPKGVMIKHSSIVASIAGMHTKLDEFGLEAGKETYLAYLPAAHILELVAELTAFSMGSAVGFADPKTISSKGACRQTPSGEINTQPGYPYPPGAIQEFRPSFMAAVPKIWDILKKGVEEVLGKGSPVKQFLFQVAYSGRCWALAQRRESPLFKALVFKKLKQMLGGRLKVGLTGGGPISADVQTFIRTSFAFPLLQGYALTETTCAGTVQAAVDTRCGVVGPPVPSVEIKIASIVGANGDPEILDRQRKPYLPTDKMHYNMRCAGRGEVLIRGPSLSSGYFKSKEKTLEVFDKEGWFHSGDVGVMTLDGALMIVDRVKNLVKLKGGEYIAIESMEKEYSASAYVNSAMGGIMCYGEGDMDRPVAFVQVNGVELERWAKGAGISYGSLEQLCKLPAAEKLVLDSMVSLAKASALGANEVLCAVALIPGTGPIAGSLTPESPWTPENGGLTASNKLNRQPILKACDVNLHTLKAKAIR